MKPTPTLITLATTALLAMLPSGQAQTTNLAVDTACNNYGNQVIVGTTYSCEASCANYGVEATVGSTYTCNGTCSNQGILVNIGSTYCGTPQPVQICSSSTCVPPPPPPTSSESSTVVAVGVGGDCVPPSVGANDFGKVWIACNWSQTPCGAVQTPVCWTVRYACYVALGPALRIYDSINQGPGNSFCEKQPGASTAMATATDGPPCYFACCVSSVCCLYSVGDCSTGLCILNLEGICDHGGTCWLNLAGVCSSDCKVNVANVCNDPCVVGAVGQCVPESSAARPR